MLGIALALVSALAWGASDFIGGLVTRKTSVVALLIVSYGVGSTILLAILLGSGDAWPGLDVVWPAVAGGAAGLVGIACLYRGLAIGTMSIVAPISATSAALPVIVGVATGDRPSSLQIAGIAAASVGVVLAALESHDDPVDARNARTAALLALGAALGIGCFFVGTDAVADESVWWSLVGARIGGCALIAVAAAATRPSFPSDARGFAPLLAVALLDTAATSLFAIASTEGLLSVIAVISALYPVSTVLLARFVLHERIRPVQTAGILLAFVGVALIAGG